MIPNIVIALAAALGGFIVGNLAVAVIMGIIAGLFGVTSVITGPFGSPFGVTILGFIGGLGLAYLAFREVRS